MNKEKLIEQLSNVLLDKNHARLAVENTLELIKKSLANGDKVMLSNFGKFKEKETKPSKFRNPKTQAEVTVAGKKRIRFKASENIFSRKK